MHDPALGYRGLGQLDELSLADSPIHRIDPRVKLVTFMTFAVCIVSFPKYEVARLAPYTLFLAFILPLARVPFTLVAAKVALVLPLALLTAAFNPFYDRQPVVTVFDLPVTGGMISFVSIIVKFVLTAAGAVTLVAVTGFNDLCAAMGRLGVPNVLTTQLLLLHRYLFTLSAEAAHMRRARDLRSPGTDAHGIRTASAVLGHLLLRTYARAERIHLAMLSRSWRGDILPHRSFRSRPADWVFCVLTCALFIAWRVMDMTSALGSLALGVLG